MAASVASPGLTVELWDDKFFLEYIQDMPFNRYMGESDNSIIQLKEDNVRRYQTINFALVNKLTGAGVTGATSLQGNEEASVSRSFSTSVDIFRHAITSTEIEEQISAINLRKAFKAQLQDWAEEVGGTNRYIAALESINGVAYSSATAAQADAWLDDNADRLMFGGTKAASPLALATDSPAGGATNDLSATLQDMTVANSGWDSEGDASAFLSRLKRKALSANPKVRPLKVKGKNQRFYVVFVHPRTMADIKNDDRIINAQKDVALKMQNNKLFQGGDIEWDGMIIHEVDNIGLSHLATAGASSIPLAPVYLCGAQAIAHAVAKRWKSIEQIDDYGNERGVGMRTIDSIAKMTFGSGATDRADLKDHGLCTGYHAVIAT